MSGRLRIGWRQAGLCLVLTAALLAAADMLAPPPLERAKDISPLVLDREDRWVRAFTTSEGRWRFPADLDDIDAVFVERLIAVEDKRFYAHPGVDPLALSRAMLDALTTGRISSGASTITMQTARLLEPRPRTVSAKLVEMIRALQIERRLTKREILELYLTLAPYGGNIEGVRAASLSWFGKEPARLTDAEQALLIALPQAPEGRRPDRRLEAARRARAEIAETLVRRALLSEARASEIEGAHLPTARRSFPGAAWHISRELAGRAKGEGVIRSTLDLSMQEAAERLAAAHAEGLKDGATTALLIVDHRTGAVRAAVGSSGLDAAGGWIDLTRAVRSPGSTLKPFIYGLAFEDGLIGPSSVIDDMPHSFGGGYSPENFDRAFHGEVSASDALQHSLNLPAVKLLERLGADKLAALLRAGGASLSAPARADRAFGLSLALGGAGASMRDLGVLYAGLANEGLAAPLVWTPAEETQGEDRKTFRLFSVESAERISRILADAPAPDGRAPSKLAGAAPRVAYKTGTSYGYRDAWAAGHAGGYTVIAWVGRADGASRPGVTGRKAAAPLLFDAFDMIARRDPEAAAPRREETAEAPAIARLNPSPRLSPPEIVFPRNGVELYSDGARGNERGFSLAARGGRGDYRWYVAGETVPIEASSGRAVWRPRSTGFYDIVVVDADGRSARAKVRVAAAG